MRDTILVTGAAGFVGRSLLPALCHAFPDARIIGLCRKSSHLISNEQVNYQSCDITDPQAVQQIIRDLKPSFVINLAAISHIPTSFKNPAKTWQVNLTGTLNLLDALVAENQACTFLQIGSGDCYGQAFATGEALNEDSPFMPMNPYAASKAAADLAAYSYRQQGQLKIIRARPFNHSGAGQPEHFVISAFAQQIAAIEAGTQPATMQVGNLDAQRCFLHVDDVVQAYIALLQHHLDINSGDAFNIVADTPVAIQTILDQLLAKSSEQIAVEQDPERQRPSDIPVVNADASKLKNLTHWAPSTSLDQLLEEIIEDWRAQLSNGNQRLLINNNPNIDFKALSTRIDKSLANYNRDYHLLTNTTGKVAAAPNISVTRYPLSIPALLSLKDEHFIREAFYTLLQRDPDESGLNHYMSKLNKGADPRAILAALRYSKEGREKYDDVANPLPMLSKYRLFAIPVFGKLLAKSWRLYRQLKTA